MAREKNGVRKPANINPLNEDPATAGDGHGLSRAAFGAGEAKALGAADVPLTPYAPVGGDSLVNSTTAGFQGQPSVTFLSDGRYVVLFQTIGESGGDVWGRIFHRDGSPAGGDFEIKAAPDSEQNLPQVAALADGGFVVVWEDNEAGTLDIRARIYEADGASTGELAIAAAGGATNETAPAVAGLPGGGFVVAWVDVADPDVDVRARIFLADGSPAGPAFTVNESPAGDQANAAVALLADGTILLVWDDSGTMDVHMRRFGANGVPIAGALTANGTTEGSQGQPCVVGLAGGGYAIAWIDNGADGDGYGIYARTFDAGGVATGPDIRVNSLTAGSQQAPAIAALPDGGFVVSWMDDTPPGSDDIRAQRFDAAGAPIGAEFVVNARTDGYQGTPALAADPDSGTLVFAWADAAAVGDDTDGAIAQRLFTPGGVPPPPPSSSPGVDLNGAGAGIDHFGTFTEGDDGAAIGAGIVVTAAGAPLTRATIAIADPAEGDGLVVNGALPATIAVLSGAGTAVLILAGTGTPAQWAAALALVRYTNASDNPDAFGADPARTISVVVSDGVNTSLAAIATLAIAAVNDAPTVTATAGTTLYAESVDTAPGSVAVDNALTVADLDDTNLASATVSITGNFQAGQDILAFDNSSGATFGNIAASYAGGTGVLTLISAGGTATPAQWQAALRAVTYSNSAEEPGQAIRTIAFAVHDGDADSAAATRLLSVTAQNDSPSGANSTVAIDEDSTFTFTAAHFGFSDVDGDSFAGVRFGAAPVGGTLYFDADGAPVAVTAFPTTTYAAVDIAAGKLTFVPTANLNGTGAASVTFTVVDDGGTAGAGRNADTAPNTLSFDIVSVNDAPSGADAAFTIDEDSAFTFTEAHFGFTDAVEGDDFLGVVIAAVPAAGTILHDGMTVTAGQFVSLHDIAVGRLTFVPALDTNGAPYSSFTFQVRDDGGALNGGQDTDQSANMVAFNVSAVNDAPVNTVPGAQGINEDASLTLSIANGNALSVADVDATTLTVTLSVGQGTLTLANTAGLSFCGGGDGTNDASMTFSGTVAAIDAALGAGLTYNPNANFNGSDAISVVTADGGQAGSGPVGTDSDSIAVGIAAINDAPSGAGATIAIDEDGARILTEADFGFGDPVEGDGFAGVVITTLPTNGILLLNGAALLVAETFVTAAQLAAGQLVFQPNADENGAAYATLTFQVRDDGGAGNGGQDTDQSPNGITFDVVSVNDAPSGTDKIVTGSEDDPYVFAAADFGYSDPGEGNGFLGVRIAALPLAGEILLNGIAVIAGDVIAVSAIETGMLVFRPGPDEFSSPYASFTFQVRDDAGTASGGQNTDQTPNRITIDITPDNLAPVLDLDAGAAGVDATFNYTENDPATPIAPAATLTDDSADFAGGTIIVRFTANGAAEDQLSIRSGGAIAVSPTDDTLIHGGVLIGFWGGGAGGADLVVQLNANATAAAVEAVLRAIFYANLSDDPSVLARTIDVAVADGDGGAASAQATIGLIAVDDAAVARGDAFTIDEAALLSGNVFLDHGAGADGDVDGPGLTIAAVNGSSAQVGQQILLASGALLILNADGSFLYATNHAFDATPTGASGASNTPAFDSFTYTLAGGGTATVTLAITGIDSDDILHGTAGDDILVAGIGNDELNGGEGNDTLYGEGGGDVARGGTGDDVYIVESMADVTEEGAGEGNDSIITSISYILSSLQEIETLSTQTHAGTDDVFLTGNQYNNTIIGNAGDNILNGVDGADVMIGLAGDDTYAIDNLGDLVLDGAGQGNDTVLTYLSHTLSNGNEIETLSTVFHQGTTAIDLGGNDYANRLIGNYGANVLNGNGGVDVMIGLNGNDIYVAENGADVVIEDAGGGVDALYSFVSYALAAGQEVETLSTAVHGSTTAIALTGNAIAQTVIGNAGANLVDGKGGSDLLYGLGGADIFAFSTALGAGNVDTIGDFVAGTDQIGLDHAIFTAIGGTLNAGAFVIGAAAGDADDRIIYNSATGALFYDADGNGGGAAIQFATLTGAPALAAGDFMMI